MMPRRGMAPGVNRPASTVPLVWAFGYHGAVAACSSSSCVCWLCVAVCVLAVCGNVCAVPGLCGLLSCRVPCVLRLWSALWGGLCMHGVGCIAGAYCQVGSAYMV